MEPDLKNVVENSLRLKVRSHTHHRYDVVVWDEETGRILPVQDVEILLASKDRGPAMIRATFPAAIDIQVGNPWDIKSVALGDVKTPERDEEETP